MGEDFDSIELMEAVQAGFRYSKMAETRWASVQQLWVRGRAASGRFGGM
ncbi:MAG: hypothetical protein PVJ86_01700 [Phycisphaerales bacterium]